MFVPTLIISGTCGVGKSTIAAEINDVLAESGIANAAIDLDALTWQWPASSAFNGRSVVREPRGHVAELSRARAQRLVLARVVEDRTELDRCRAAVPGAEISVCRLVAPESLRIDRLWTRMPPGASRDWHERRTVELEAILQRAAVEDFVVVNDDRSAREVALDVLRSAGRL